MGICLNTFFSFAFFKVNSHFFITATNTKRNMSTETKPARARTAAVVATSAKVVAHQSSEEQIEHQSNFQELVKKAT